MPRPKRAPSRSPSPRRAKAPRLEDDEDEIAHLKARLKALEERKIRGTATSESPGAPGMSTAQLAAVDAYDLPHTCPE